MQAKIIDRKWVVEWFDERQCYHMPSLTLADNGNLLAVWNGGFLQWNGDPMGRDAKDWVSVLEPGAKEWSNPDAVGCDIRYCCHDPVFLKNKKGEIILLFAKFLDTEVNFTTWCNGRDELWTRKTKDGALLACILDMGELLLTSGAEVMRVEDTLTRLCMVYGFAQADVFTITSSIVLTVRTPEGRALTQTRRIRARDTDLGRVERVNALSRRLCAGPLPPEKFRQAVEEVRNAPAYPDAAQCAMYAVISAAFSVFFGGTLRDAATAAVSGMLLFGALRFCQRLRLNGILQSMLASALAALAVMLMVGFGLGQNPDKIIIGNIMLLIPGIALTTSLRDMINGDTISGLLGLSEAVLKALAIAIGFAAVLMRMGG